MNRKKIRKKIKNRKAMLNFLLLFMKRTNPIVVLVSQNLDAYIYDEQKLILTSYKKKNTLNKLTHVA